MSAAVSRPTPYDWRDVEPSEWPYLVDLLTPAVPDARSSGLVLRTAATRDFPDAHRAALGHAVRVVGAKLPPERRWDLRQDLAIVLLTKDVSKVRNVEAFLVTLAQRWVTDERQRDAFDQEIQIQGYEPGAKRRYRKGKDDPRWYPPHDDAEEFAPFACRGARLMHYERREDFADVETEMVNVIDARTALGMARQRSPTSSQEAVAEREIQRQRAPSRKALRRLKFARLLF